MAQKSESQLHYESVKSFLIWAVGIASTIIVLLGGWVTFLTFKDRSEMRTEYEHEIDRYKESLSEMRIEATDKQKEISDRTDREMAFLKESSQTQLANIDAETRQAANDQAQKEVADVFRSDKMQAVIEKNAIGELKDKLPSTIAEYTKRFPKILEAAGFMRGGAPEGIDMLKTYFNSDSEFERDMSKNTYQDISNDFYKMYSDIPPAKYVSTFKSSFQVNFSEFHKIVDNKYPTNKEDITNLELLMKMINDTGKQYMLFGTAFALQVVSYIADRQFLPFEIEEVNAWYKGLKK